MRPLPRPLPTRPRWQVRIRPRRLVAVALAVLSAALVLDVVESATAARARWGPTGTVVVARATIEAGETVAPDDVERRAVPRELTPPAAVRDGAVGRIATSTIHAGEIVIESRLAADGTQVPAALVPAGHRAVAVPSSGFEIDVATGDRVDVVVVLDPSMGPDGALVTADVRVVDVSEDAVTVSVPTAQVAEIARALVAGTAVLALHP